MRYVYVITNLVNGKVYVGQTKNPKARKAGHWRAARIGVECHLYESMRKHGSENYTFRVLEECDDDTVDDRERFWIAHYNSMNPEIGYNKESGGHANKTLAEETKRKISVALTGQQFTPERCVNISAGLKGKSCLAGRRENNPEKGKNVSRALTGRSLSVAHKRAVSEGVKAYMSLRPEWHPSEDARRRMSIAQKVVGDCDVRRISPRCTTKAVSCVWDNICAKEVDNVSCETSCEKTLVFTQVWKDRSKCREKQC